MEMANAYRGIARVQAIDTSNAKTMAEVVEEFEFEERISEADAVRFSYSRPEQSWINRSLIRLIERLSG